MTAKKNTGMPAKRPAAKKPSDGFTAEERAAMKERVREMKSGKADGESDVLAKIAEMSEPDRTIAKRLHAIMKTHAPSLSPKTWYGMPAYADENGKPVCFFQPAEKFKARYATFGFNDSAKLDDGNLWPIGFALKTLGAGEETKIIALVKKAVS